MILNNIDLYKVNKLEVMDNDIINEINNFIFEYYNNYTGLYLKKINIQVEV